MSPQPSVHLDITIAYAQPWRRDLPFRADGHSTGLLLDPGPAGADWLLTPYYPWPSRALGRHARRIVAQPRKLKRGFSGYRGKRHGASLVYAGQGSSPGGILC